MDKECYQFVPCGKCPECKARRVSAWSFRLQQEEKRSYKAAMYTLTYDNKHVPITPTGFLTTSKRDCQLFFKRLRFRLGDIPNHPRIKYYLASEYGGTTWRPHYHIIMFNVINPLDVDAAWQLGSIDVKPCTPASIGYALKYINKPPRIPVHRNDDRTPEFGLMSKGLGLNYLTPEMIAWHKNDLKERMHLVLPQGQKVSMPRYYKDKLYTDEEREALAEHHAALMRQRESNLHEKYGSGELARLRAEHLKSEAAKFYSNFKKDKL